MLLLFLILSLDSLLLQGIEYGYEEKYDRAEAVFLEARNQEPENPASYFFLSMLYAAYMTDFGTDTLESKFFAYVDTTINKAVLIERNRQNPWNYVWKGGALMNRAYYRYEKGNILGMFEDGLSAVRELNKGLVIDSSLYDAYIGIGIQDYISYRVKKALPLMNGNNIWREKLEIASDSAHFLSVAAKSTLAILLIEEKKWDESIRITKDLLKKYPDSRTFTWTLAKAYLGEGDWKNAERTYKKLIRLIEHGQPDSYYSLVFAMDKLMQIYFYEGKYERCRIEVSKILDITEGLGERYKGFRKRAKSYLTKEK